MKKLKKLKKLKKHKIILISLNLNSKIIFQICKIYKINMILFYA